MKHSIDLWNGNYVWKCIYNNIHTCIQYMYHKKNAVSAVCSISSIHMLSDKTIRGSFWGVRKVYKLSN